MIIKQTLTEEQLRLQAIVVLAYEKMSRTENTIFFDDIFSEVCIRRIESRLIEEQEILDNVVFEEVNLLDILCRVGLPFIFKDEVINSPQKEVW